MWQDERTELERMLQEIYSRNNITVFGNTENADVNAASSDSN